MRALVALALAALLGGCAGAERREDPLAGTFRMTSAATGDARVLALVPGADDVPLLRLVDASPDVAGGAEIASGDATAIADWRIRSFGRGLYRVGSAEADERLSLSAGYGSSAGVTLAPSRRTSFQLWYVVPLQDGFCRLASALFPDASLDVGEDARTPRLAPSADDAPGQRWRLAPLAGTTADGLPALCSGEPRAETPSS